MRVLLVDDDLSTRMVSKRILERADYEVFTASNGLAAWEFLEKTKVDVMVCDLSMPELSGMELFKRVKDDPRTCHLRLIACTSDGSRDSVQSAIQNQVTSYILKPISAPELLKKVGVEARAVSPHLDEFRETTSRLGIDLRDYLEMLRALVEEVRKKHRELRPKLQSGDVEAVESARLFYNASKGGAANLGAHGLRAATEIAERNLKIDSDAAAANELYLLNVEAELDRLEASLKK